MDEITDGGEFPRAVPDRRRRDAEYHVRTAGILFDPTEVEWLQFSEDPIPNLRKMFQNYSSGYFKAPSVGAGTANTEFEVLTGMSMRFFGPGEYPYKTYAKTKYVESAASALSALGYVQRHCTITGWKFLQPCTGYITIWDLTIIPAKSL